MLRVGHTFASESNADSIILLLSLARI